jgi:hypothetical protein
VHGSEDAPTEPATIHCLILCGRFIIHLFEDPAEIRYIIVAAIGCYLFYSQPVIVQHELRPVHAHQIQIVTEARLPFLPEES